MHATSNKRQRKDLPSLRMAAETIPPPTRPYDVTLHASGLNERKAMDPISIPPFPSFTSSFYNTEEGRRYLSSAVVDEAPRPVSSRPLMPRLYSNPLPYATSSRPLDCLPRSYNGPNAPSHSYSSSSWHYNPHSPSSHHHLGVQHIRNGEPPIQQYYPSIGHNNKKITYTIGPGLSKEFKSQNNFSQVPTEKTYVSLDKSYQHLATNACEACRKKNNIQYRSVGTMTDFEDPLEAFATNMFHAPTQSTDPLPIDFHSIDGDGETPCSLSKLFTFDETSYGPINEGTNDACYSKSHSPNGEEDWSVDSHPTDSLPFFRPGQKLSADLPIALQITDTLSSSDESERHKDWSSLSNSVVNSEVTEETSLSADNKMNRKLRPRRRCTVQGCSNRVVQGGLCISHGAKRKPCGYLNCPKFVKNAGMCSAHGPRRKRCLIEGCEKAAVQNGTCIAHGAKKKLCVMEGCERQGVVKGKCKRHWAEEKKATWATCQPCYPTT